MKPSGIGGQAVIEGIMMRNKNIYSVAVRKPDKTIEVMKKESSLLTEKYKYLNYPIIRGVVNFVESLVIGTSILTYSASFYEEEEEEKESKLDRIAKSVFKDKLDSVLMFFTVAVSILFAVGLFMILPYFASRLVSGVFTSRTVLNLIEGLIRVGIFIGYILLISMMKDIHRVFMYHGAEHKCINCIENGHELTVENVRMSSREHKRCGTSFIFFVMFISIIFFIFIQVDSKIMQVILRLVLVPIIAGVSYEVIRWAGRSDSGVVNVISRPGMWLQGLTTREPDDDMIEVGIRAVEEVFDWKKFLSEGTDYSSISSSDSVVINDTAAVMKENEIEKIQETEDNDDIISNEETARILNPAYDVLYELDDEVEEDILEESVPLSEAEEELTNMDQDDGIHFVEEEQNEPAVEEIPLFKQRSTEI